MDLSSKIKRIQQSCAMFTKTEPPEDLVRKWWGFKDEAIELQDWVSDNLKKEFQWCTAIGVIEGIIHIVIESEQNES